MAQPASERFNPFPGLRPFQTEEDYLFFGREEQTAALLTLLREHRFLAVVGSSGSGKSSLVRAGLIPALHGGAMTRAGSHWEVAVFRPGGDPITNLARALLEADLYDAQDPEALQRLRATLTRSRFGLGEALRQSDAVDDRTNLFVLVDQFEELFRFREHGGDHQESAAAFVKLLLTASEESDVKIYVALTMRSDYLGDSAQIPGLAQAINKGEFLIPRLTRDQKRDAIEKPVGVGGARIAPRLSQQMLNDVGDDPDQLPILQHALMRTWEVWVADHSKDEPLDLRHYETTGGMAAALSQHADEVYASIADDDARARCEKIFRTLTEKTTENRGIRRPTRLENLEAIVGASREQTLRVLDAFRAPGVTFLMPGPDHQLHGRTVIDLSHESLMRVWARLRDWVEAEAVSARVYRRLAETALLWKDGKAGLYRDPDLSIATSWLEKNLPNDAWAAQYGRGFDVAMDFLETSRDTAEAEERAREKARQRELRQAKVLADTQSRAARTFKRFAAVVGVLAIAATLLALWAFELWDRTDELLDESRHDQGELWLERARRQLAEHEFLGAKLMAARAVGFEGFGRAGASEAFRREHEVLLNRESSEWQAARDLVLFEAEVPLIWSSPSTRLEASHFHPFLNHDGSRLAWTDHSAQIALWDTATGEQLPSLFLESPAHGLPFFGRDRMLSQRTDRLELREFPSGRRLEELPGDVRFRSSGGVTYLYRLEDEKLEVFSVLTGKPVGEPVEVPATTADHFLVFADLSSGIAAKEGVLYRFDLTGEEPVREVATYEGRVRDMDCTVDGRFVFLRGSFLADSRSNPSSEPDSGEVNVRSDTLVYDATTHEYLYEMSVGIRPRSAIPVRGAEICFYHPQVRASRLFDLETRQVTAIHPGRLSTVSGDGSVAVLEDERSLRLVDLETGEVRGDAIDDASFGGLEGARFHPGGRFFMTYGPEGLRFRRTATGEVFQRLRDMAVTSAAFRPDGRQLATCEPLLGKLRLWNAEPLLEGSPPVEIDAVDSRARFVLFDPTGNRLAVVEQTSGGATSSGPTRLRVIDRPGGETLLTRIVAGADVPVAFHPNGFELALVCPRRGRLPDRSSPRARPGGGEEILKIVDLDGRELDSFDMLDSVDAIAFSPDGRWLGSASSTAARLLDRETGRVVALPSSTDGALASLAFAPGNSLVAFGSMGSGFVTLFDPASQKEMARIPAHAEQISSLDFSPDGRALLSASRDSTARIWERTPREVSLGPVAQKWTSWIRYHPDGKHLLLRAGTGVGVLNVTTGSERIFARPSERSDYREGLIDLHPDGSRMLVQWLGERGAESIQMMDLGDGRILGELVHEDATRAATFAPDGRRIATVAGGRLYLWDTETLERLEVHGVGSAGDELTSVDWGAKGNLVAIAGPSSVVLWDTRTGQSRRTLARSETVAVRFQPRDAAYLATIDSEGTVFVHDTRTWDVVRRFQGPFDGPTVTGTQQPILRWHPEGASLVYRGTPTGIEVRDVVTGAALGRLEREPEDVRRVSTIPGLHPYLSADFSPDGRRIAATLLRSMEGDPVTIWDWGAARDPSRFASYLDVYEFKKSEPARKGASINSDSLSGEDEATDVMPPEERESGEIVPRTVDSLYAARSFSMRPVSGDSHIAILRQESSETEKDRQLLHAYLQASSWEAAARVLRRLPTEEASEARSRFATAASQGVKSLLERSSSRTTRTRERLAARWLELAGQFDAESPSVAEARALHDRLRKEREEQLAAERHAEGLRWLEKSRAYRNDGRTTEAKLVAAKALGFEGLGREELPEELQREHPPLLRPGSREWNEATDLARHAFELPLAWQTPTAYRNPWVNFQACISRDGNMVAISGLGGVRVWDRQTGERLHDFEADSSASIGCQFHPTDTLLAVGDFDGKLSIHDLQTGMSVASWNSPGSKAIPAVCFTPSGRQLIAGLEDGSLHLLDAADCKSVQVFSGHTSQVFHVVFRPAAGSESGRQLASASEDGTIKLWSLESGEILRSFPGNGGGMVGLTFSSRGDLLLGNERGHGVHIWKVESGEHLGLLETIVDSGVAQIAWLPSTGVLAVGSESGSIELWDVRNQEQVGQLTGHRRLPRFLDVSADGKTLVSSDGPDGREVLVWDLESRSRIGRGPAGSHDAPVTSLSVHPRGHLLVSSDASGNSIVWSLQDGTAVNSLPGAPAGIRQRALYTPDGSRIVLARDESFALFDAETNELHEPGWTDLPARGAAQDVPPIDVRQEGKSGEERQDLETRLPVAVKSNGETLAIGRSDGSIVLFDLASRELERSRPPQAGSVYDVAWHPDDVHLVSCEENGAIRVWNTNSEEVELREFHSTGFLHVTPSPDGRWIAANTSYFATLRLFDFRTNALRNLVPMDSPPGPAAFSPDGEYLAVGTRSGQLEIRQTRLGLELLTSARSSDSPLTSLVFAPDGRSIITGSESGAIRLHECAPALPRFPEVEGFQFCLRRDGEAMYSGIGGSLLEIDILTGTELDRHTEFPRSMRGLVLSGDGRRLASVHERQDADGRFMALFQARSLETRQVLATHSMPGRPFLRLLALDRTGSRLACAVMRGDGKQEIHFVDVEKNELASRYVHQGSAFWSLAFDPRSADLLFGDWQQLWKIDPTTGQVRERVESSGLSFWSDIAYTRDGSVAVGRSLRSLVVLNPETLEEVRTIPLPVREFGGVSISDDGSVLASRCRQDPWLRLYSIDSGAVLTAFPMRSGGRSMHGFTHRFVPGSPYVADLSDNGDVRLWDTRSRPRTALQWQRELERHEFADGEVRPIPHTNLLQWQAHGMEPWSSTSHVAILRQVSLTDLERGKALFKEYLHAQNWSSAAVVLEGLPREETVDARRRLTRALELLARGARETEPLLAARWQRMLEALESP